MTSRIDEMANDIENKLCDELQFSLQLHGTTLRDNEALILAYVSYINTSHEVIAKFLFAKQLEVDTKGSKVYKVVEQFFKQKVILLLNVISCATDGVPSMVGRHRRFIVHLKREIPDIFTIHCVIHRQHLAAKQLSNRLHCTLQTVIKAVNKIKAHSLYGRIFRQLCHKNKKDFERLLFIQKPDSFQKTNVYDAFMISMILLMISLSLNYWMRK